MKKNDFKISKNIIISVAGGVLALIVILSLQKIYIINAQVAVPVTTDGNSGINISKLQLAPKKDGQKLINIEFDSQFDNGLNFRVFGTSILDNLISIGDTFFEKPIAVGYATEQAGSGATELKVNGNIVIKELADPACIDQASCDAIADVELCANDFGVLLRCI